MTRLTIARRPRAPGPFSTHALGNQLKLRPSVNSMHRSFPSGTKSDTGERESGLRLGEDRNIKPASSRGGEGLQTDGETT
jgi:hypothetical protein